MTSQSVKLLNYNKPILNGIFAVFKEKGEAIQDYQTWIRLTLKHENSVEFGAHGIKEIVKIVPKYMEPFASGVACVGLGHRYIGLIHLTRFWNHEWLVTAKLGTGTETHLSDSQVIKEMPFNHITRDMLSNSLQSFIGTNIQLSPPFIQTNSLLLKREPTHKTTKSITNEPPIGKLRDCHSIELISFDAPVFKLRVISDGYFSIRALIRDIGLKLDSCATVTDLFLSKMGPISSDESGLLKKHQLHLNNICQAIQKYTSICAKDLKQFEGLVADNRRII